MAFITSSKVVSTLISKAPDAIQKYVTAVDKDLEDVANAYKKEGLKSAMVC